MQARRVERHDGVAEGDPRLEGRRPAPGIDRDNAVQPAQVDQDVLGLDVVVEAVATAHGLEPAPRLSRLVDQRDDLVPRTRLRDASASEAHVFPFIDIFDHNSIPREPTRPYQRGAGDSGPLFGA